MIIARIPSHCHALSIICINVQTYRMAITDNFAMYAGSDWAHPLLVLTCQYRTSLLHGYLPFVFDQEQMPVHPLDGCVICADHL